MSSKKSECEVCCEARKTVFSCPFCEYKSCTQCNERVILESINMPCCMNCKKEFTSDFFHQTFTNAFITKRFKARREQILYEKEKFLLPATQPQVEKIVKKKKFQEEISVLKKQIEELKARTKALQYELMKLDDDEDDEDTEGDDDEGYF